MTSYVLSEEADADIRSIFLHSVAQWGLVRAEQYVMALHDVFEMLTCFPDLGRDVGYIRIGYFRYDHERHTVFFKKQPPGVFVVRILGIQQQHTDHLAGSRPK